MGLQYYTQDTSKIPLKYHKRVLFYTKYTHPTLICGGTDARTENIYSIFRDKLLLLGEHVFNTKVVNYEAALDGSPFVAPEIRSGSRFVV